MSRDRRIIMHVITGLARHGTQGVLASLIRGSAGDLNHVVVSLTSDGYWGPVLRREGVPVYLLRIGNPLDTRAGLGALRALISGYRVSVVQTWLYHADVLGGLAATLGGVPVVWGIRNRNLDVASIGCATQFVARIGARLSWDWPAAIACASSDAAAHHEAFGYCGRKMVVIPNGFDLTEFRQDCAAGRALREELGIEQREAICGMVARWDRQKDHANLLSAMEIVCKRDPNVRLLLVGDGMSRENAELITRLDRHGLLGRTVLAGQRSDVWKVMNAIDLHVLSSRGEAFPNVIGEAMACGTPCVATAVGDTQDIVGDTGWVVPPARSLELAHAIRLGLDGVRKDGKAHYGAIARSRIERNYSLARMSSRYAELWHEASLWRRR